jgi:hypothetical protein
MLAWPLEGDSGRPGKTKAALLALGPCNALLEAWKVHATNGQVLALAGERARRATWEKPKHWYGRSRATMPAAKFLKSPAVLAVPTAPRAKAAAPPGRPPGTALAAASAQQVGARCPTLGLLGGAWLVEGRERIPLSLNDIRATAVVGRAGTAHALGMSRAPAQEDELTAGSCRLRHRRGAQPPGAPLGIRGRHRDDSRGDTRPLAGWQPRRSARGK